MHLLASDLARRSSWSHPEAREGVARDDVLAYIDIFIDAYSGGTAPELHRIPRPKLGGTVSHKVSG